MLVGIGGDPALALEILARLVAQRYRASDQRLVHRVEPVEPVADPSAADFEHHQLEAREPVESAEMKKAGEGVADSVRGGDVEEHRMLAHVFVLVTPRQRPYRLERRMSRKGRQGPAPWRTPRRDRDAHAACGSSRTARPTRPCIRRAPRVRVPQRRPRDRRATDARPESGVRRSPSRSRRSSDCRRACMPAPIRRQWIRFPTTDSRSDTGTRRATLRGRAASRDLARPARRAEDSRRSLAARFRDAGRAECPSSTCARTPARA